MNINIWSDVRCPFCYIGKRKFEMALEKFPHKDEVKVTWHSFELDPNLETKTDVNAIEHLAEHQRNFAKPRPKECRTCNASGKKRLDLILRNAVVANSFNAHRLIQLAKTNGLEMKQKSNYLKLILLKEKILTTKKLWFKQALLLDLMKMK